MSKVTLCAAVNSAVVVALLYMYGLQQTAAQKHRIVFCRGSDLIKTVEPELFCSCAIF